jgi:hypothetical protein
LRDLCCYKKTHPFFDFYLHLIQHCTNGHRDYDCDFEGPKELPLSDVNLDGKEWNLDFFNESGQDDTILGLFRLGGKAET